MLGNIPQSRLILYILLLGLLPMLLAAFYYMNRKSGLDEIENTLLLVQQRAYNYEKKQAQNVAARVNFRDADHFYIDKNLETLTFLEPEIESLQKITTNKNFPDDENVKKRLEFLTGGGNSLLFTEGVVQRQPHFQEVTETLVHPVEVNNADIQKILARIEGVQIGTEAPGPSRPQLIILDFKLDKKSISEKNEVYNLNMKLLKREFQ